MKRFKKSNDDNELICDGCGNIMGYTHSEYCDEYQHYCLKCGKKHLNKEQIYG